MFKKSLVALALTAPLSAFAALTTFSNASLGGSNTFDFAQIQISGGNSQVVLTDTNNSGALDIGDTFVETGLVAGVAFTDAATNPISATITGITTQYELWAIFSPLNGYISGATVASVGPVTVQSFTANFTVPSAFTIYYDTTIGGGFNAGTSTVIGLGTLPSTDSNCVVTSTTIGGSSTNTGACLMNFAFDAAGPTKAGVWTQAGQDLGSYDTASIRIDMNVDNFAPSFFSPTFDTVGGTQTRFIDHNGSASFTVPEPGSLAITGLGLLSALGLRRRKSA